MGGYSIDPSQSIHPPDTKLTEALLSMQAGATKPMLDQQNRLLEYASSMPMESWTPDIFGQGTGAMDTAAQVGAINAFRSADLESKTNPNAQIMRQTLPKMLAEDLGGTGLQKQMDDWTSRHGIARLLGSGMQDSTIGKSALFDAATQEGAALRRANEQAAAAYLSANQAPVAGIDPASANAALQGAAAQGMQQRQQRQQSLLGNLQSNAQSTTDWINQMINSTSNATNAYQSNWQNYNQAMMNASAQKASQKNAENASMIGAGGTAVGIAAAAAL
jgi:hypothetical protein